MRKIALALMSMLAAAPAARAQGNVQLYEQEIQAGLLYNFLKYTQWPAPVAQPAGNVVVCLWGGDPFGGHLQPIEGRTVNQRSIEIRKVSEMRDMGACSLLFIHSDEKPKWPQLRAWLAGKDILTVSNFDGFIESGGMIQLTKIGDRIAAKINVDVVTAAHLAVQDRLLRLASPVRSSSTD